MAAFKRESDYLHLYKDAFSNQENVEKLVKVFISARTLFDQSLLVKMGVITKEEWRDIEEQSRGRITEKREKKARSLILIVKQKDSLRAYCGFRGYVKERSFESR